jgi:hypothetical protein
MTVTAWMMKEADCSLTKRYNHQGIAKLEKPFLKFIRN